MLGDDHCDPSCNTEACSYDLFDCGCAPNCDFSDLGQCKPECLVPECNYDWPGGSLRTELQAVNCADAVCQEIGNREECMLIDTCEDTQLGTAIQYQVLMKCCDNCCLEGFESLPENPYVCVRHPDRSSASHPHQIFVSSAASDGDGTFQRPFPDLSQALWRVYEQFTEIVLLPGRYFIKADNPVVLSYYLYSSQNKTSAFPNGLASLSILTYACLEFPCERATILKNEDSMPSFFLEGVDLFQVTNVNFTSELPFSLCTSFFQCGSWDDLFLVFSTIRLENVTFAHFHKAVESIINLDNASAELTNVVFEDILLRYANNECMGIIKSSSFASVKYSGGRVHLLNQGHDYVRIQAISGFICLKAADLTIQGVVFTNNFVDIFAPKSYGIFGSLIYAEQCFTCVITGCTFENNIGYNGTVFYYSAYNWQAVSTSLSQAEKILASTVAITNCVFRNNTGNVGSTLLFEFGTHLHSVTVANCSFEHELAATSGVVCIRSLGTKFVGSKDVSRQAVNAKGYAVSVTFPAAEFRLLNLSFTNCTSLQYGLVSIVNITAVLLSDISIATPQTSGVTRLSNTLAAWASLSAHIPKNIPGVAAPLSTCGVNLTAVGNVTIERMRVTGLRTAGGVFVSGARDVLLALASVEDCRGNLSHGHALHIDAERAVDIRDSQFQSNSNVNEQGRGSVFLTGASVTVDSCSFANNTSWYGGGLYVQNASFLCVSHCYFRSNSGDHGGALLLSLAIYSVSRFSMRNSSFVENTATSAGAAVNLHLDKDSAVLTLTIETSEFLSNSAPVGSGLYVASGVCLAGESRLTGCEAHSNTAVSGGTLHFDDSKGNFRVADSNFSWNRGDKGAVMYIKCSNDRQNQPCTVALQTVSFVNNTGSSIFEIADSPDYKKVMAAGVNCTGNVGTCVVVQHTELLCSESVFQANEEGALHAVASNVSFEFTRFLSNSVPTMGGAGLIEESSHFFCSSCEFSDNTAVLQGGALSVQQHSSVTLVSCRFLRNYSGDSGFALQITMSEVESRIEDCWFEGNSGVESGTISVLSVVLAMRRCTVTGNRSKNRMAGVAVYLSVMWVSDSLFAAQSGFSGSFLYFLHSTGSIEQSVFEDGFAATLGGGIVSLNTDLRIANSSFARLASRLGGAISLQNGSIVQIEACSFASVKCLDRKKGLIDSWKSQLSIRATRFESYEESAVSALESVLLVTESWFASKCSVDARASLGGGVLCTLCVSVSISHSLFTNLTSDSGAAVYLLGGQNRESENWPIDSCVFAHNSVTSVGSVYLESVFVVLTNNSFVGNKAGKSGSVGMGGALALMSKGDRVMFQVVNNSFVENWAESEGGAVFWEGSEPHFSENVFVNNEALYGANIASKAIRLALAPESALELLNVPSGQHLKVSLTLQLLDHYDSIVTSDSSSYALIASLDPHTSLAAVTRVQALHGKYVFNDFVVVSPPGRNTSVLISTSALTEKQSVTVRVVMRDCEVGETFDNDQCLPCGVGTYSLDPMLSCQICPAEALCYGNFTMVPRSGYWRPSHLTARFLPCPNPEACLGSPQSSVLNLTGECAEGYGGVMCQSCLPGFFRWAKVYCAPCSSLSAQVALKVGISTLLVVLLAFVMYASVKPSSWRNRMNSVRIRVFINYIQLMMQLGSLNLTWPSLMLQLFHAQEQLGAFPESIFSLSCLIAGDTEADAYFREMLTLAALLPAVVLLVALICGVSRLVHDSPPMSEFISAGILVYMLSLPSVMRVMLSAFHCLAISKDEYWLAGPEVRCWTATHLKYALGLALPSIVLWGLIVPAGLFGLLFRQRREIESLNTRKCFGFLTHGYRAQTYYWELVCLYRKLIVVLLAVLSSGLSVTYQVLACLALLCGSITLQQEFQPFAQFRMNSMETRGLVATVVTLYCGMLYTAEMTGQAAQVAIFVVVLLVNVYFLAISLRDVAMMCVRSLFALVAACVKKSPQQKGEINNELEARNCRSDSAAPFADGPVESSAKNAAF